MNMGVTSILIYTHTAYVCVCVREGGECVRDVHAARVSRGACVSAGESVSAKVFYVSVCMTKYE